MFNIVILYDFFLLLVDKGQIEDKQFLQFSV